MSGFNKLLLTALVVTIVATSGCASRGWFTTDEGLKARAKELNKREMMIKQRERKLTTSAPASASASSSMAMMSPSGNLLPPNAQSGECYARVWAPHKYETISDRVLVQEASERVQVTPAKYEWDTERIMVKEATSRLVTSPAVYGTTTETVKVREEQYAWKTSLGKNGAPASAELLATAKAHGINLDAAKPGMCYHEHYRPATYTTENERVMASEASEKVVVTQASYRTVDKRVLVKEAATKVIEVPVTYKTVSERVIDKPAHTIWKKGTGPIQRIDEATGEIMCLVEVPASYKTLKKRVVVTPASTRTMEIPAEYKTIKVRELVSEGKESRVAVPATYKNVKHTKKTSEPSFVWHEIHHHGEPTSTRTGAKICLTKIPAKYEKVTRRVVKKAASSRRATIPADYKTVKVRKVVSPASEKRIAIPEKYKTVTSQKLVREGHMEWRSILCKTNTTSDRIRQIQSSLKSAGYNPGPIDGVVGSETMSAVNAFQRAKGLPVDRYLNVETIRALGVSPL